MRREKRITYNNGQYDKLQKSRTRRGISKEPSSSSSLERRESTSS